MASKLLFVICFVVSVWEVFPMALKGPVMTRYDPCGLGVIHFDRLRENYWKGYVHFELYKTLSSAKVEIVFKDEVTVAAIPGTLNITASRTTKSNFIVESTRIIPDRYEFVVSLNNLKTNESDVPLVELLTLNNVTLCNAEIKAAQTIKSLNVSQQYPYSGYAHVCGRRSLDHTELVSTRTEAEAGDWPWHVAILVIDKKGLPRYECGGNIVSTTAIVTAGHCVFKNGALREANKIVIVAGTKNYKDFNETGRQEFVAEEIILHPAYDDDFATSDVAVIKVKGLVFTEYVQPVCIYGPVYDKSKLFGVEAIVVGFGTTEYDKLSDVLRSTYTVIQNDTTCIDFSPKLYSSLLNEFTLCVGYGPSSSINPRNGDSGGGLVISTVQSDHKISWFLRGVLSKCGVSPGHKTCDPKYYVVYTDVAPHYGWIYHHAGLEYRNNIM
ncbi:unnamed protein product [Chrysodeixis includens]|uniref:Peptidase S1 domain-containing protein n=1 Tax=Chrysodeixis includens TaxID=689277 RepID=A0A9P0FZW3_CHRIL|nr:unnamed protein product [Chrysodeixis includens]